MTDKKTLDLIADIKRLSAFGMLARDNTITFPQAMAIMAHLTEPVDELDAKHAEATELRDLKAKLSAANGKLGGLTKKCNALASQVSDQNALKENSRKLSRIANAASDFVEEVGSYGFTDANDHPLENVIAFVRMKEEVQ